MGGHMLHFQANSENIYNWFRCGVLSSIRTSFTNPLLTSNCSKYVLVWGSIPLCAMDSWFKQHISFKKMVHKVKCHGCRLVGSLCMSELHSGQLDINVALNCNWISIGSLESRKKETGKFLCWESFHNLKFRHTQKCLFFTICWLFYQTYQDCLFFSMGLSANSAKALVWAGTTNWCRSTGISCCPNTAGGDRNSTKDVVEFM